MKTDRIHINKIYTLARSMKYGEFLSAVGRLIDDIPATQVNDNEYYMVNRKNIKGDISKFPKEINRFLTSNGYGKSTKYATKIKGVTKCLF